MDQSKPMETGTKYGADAPHQKFEQGKEKTSDTKPPEQTAVKDEHEVRKV